MNARTAYERFAEICTSCGGRVNFQTVLIAYQPNSSGAAMSNVINLTREKTDRAWEQLNGTWAKVGRSGRGAGR